MILARLVLLCMFGMACGEPDDELAARCPALTAAGGLPASVSEAQARRAAGAEWTDADIRARYVCTALDIGRLDAEAAAAGMGWEDRAHLAYDRRHAARLIARAMMADPAAVEALRQRDRERYGDPDGPTFDYLVQKGQAEGLTDEALWRSIIEGAQRTNEATNRLFGLL